MGNLLENTIEERGVRRRKTKNKIDHMLEKKKAIEEKRKIELLKKRKSKKKST